MLYRFSHTVLISAFFFAQIFSPSWASDLEFFETSIRPVLAEKCFKCHGPERQKGELRVDHIDFLLQGGESGSALVPGDAASRIVTAIGYEDVDFQMPPKGKLPDEDIANIMQWISMGAPWPTEPLPTSDQAKEDFNVSERRLEHWAWQPVTQPLVPPVENEAWGDPIDRFVHARLSEAALVPAMRAERNTLLRRASYDLVGLPPTQNALAGFIADDSPEAWEREVDTLLSSPRFGERWARHWLDLVRYADSYGHEGDFPIRLAWQYRDYVIRALNADVPYDQFVREHIAGDLLESPRAHPTKGYNESVIGTGFWFLHQATHGPVDVLQDEADRIENQIDVLSKAFLGMTVACARCHDHKFDAVTTKDYYALSGVLKSSRQGDAMLDVGGAIRAAIYDLDGPIEELKSAFQKNIAKVAKGKIDLDVWMAAARDVLYGDWMEADGPTPYREDIVFETFESEEDLAWEEGAQEFVVNYSDRAKRRIASPLRRVIERFALNSREQSESSALRSNPFSIKRNYIEFLLGGGGEREKLSFDLIVDDQVVLSASPAESRELTRIIWDVTAYIGQEGHFVFTDNDEERRAYLSVDYIVFSDDPSLHEMRRPIESVAKLRGLDAESLEEWIAFVTRGEMLSTPEVRETAPDDETWHRFSSNTFGDWVASGQAFGTGPAQAGEIAIMENTVRAVAAGTVHSGLVSDKLTGVLRSPTFILSHDAIHYHAEGTNARIRLVIDGYQIRLHNPILFDDTLSNVNTDGEYAWITQHKRLDAYRGQRAYIELMDEGDGYIALDAIVFSNNSEPPTSLAPGPDATIPRSVMAAANLFLGGTADSLDTGLLNVLIEGGAHDLPRSIKRKAARYWEAAEAIPQPMTVMAMVPGTTTDDRVHIRGTHKNLGEVVPRRFLEALDGAPYAWEESGRLGLAAQIASEENPLTARVFVNRVWHHLMGRGIVPTVDNFGVLGERPSHPALLEYLSARFQESGWSLKGLIKDIMMSETYRMSSVPSSALAEAQDPANFLLHRANLKRLEGEIIRDAMLAVSQRLNDDMYGPGIPVYVSEASHGDVLNGNSSGEGDTRVDGDGRRSIYLKHRRNVLPPMLKLFDLPTPNTTSGQRAVTNTPSQALMMMNDPFVKGQAEYWAEKTAETHSAVERIASLFEAAFSRPARPAEIKTSTAFIKGQAKRYEITTDEAFTDERVWADLCHVVFTMKEFIFVG